MAVRTERSEVRTKTTEGQYSPVRLEQARLVSSLLYGTRVMLVSKLPAFENKKYTSYDHFHGNGPYGKIPTKKEPIRTPGFTPRLPCHIIIRDICTPEDRLNRFSGNTQATNWIEVTKKMDGQYNLACWIINLLLDVLLCSKNKNTQQYYTTKRLIRYIFLQVKR